MDSNCKSALNEAHTDSEDRWLPSAEDELPVLGAVSSQLTFLSAPVPTRDHWLAPSVGRWMGALVNAHSSVSTSVPSIRSGRSAPRGTYHGRQQGSQHGSGGGAGDLSISAIKKWAQSKIPVYWLGDLWGLRSPLVSCSSRQISKSSQPTPSPSPFCGAHEPCDLPCPAHRRPLALRQ